MACQHFCDDQIMDGRLPFVTNYLNDEDMPAALKNTFLPLYQRLDLENGTSETTD